MTKSRKKRCEDFDVKVAVVFYKKISEQANQAAVSHQYLETSRVSLKKMAFCL